MGLINAGASAQNVILFNFLINSQFVVFECFNVASVVLCFNELVVIILCVHFVTCCVDLLVIFVHARWILNVNVVKVEILHSLCIVNSKLIWRYLRL